ncbi:TlpA family protein disulfide reductase, partial [Zunongwangia atlantica 22II14-10F7]
GDHIAKQAERELRNLSFVNTSLPDLDLKTLKGKSYDINHLKDQYLVLNFWYTTCGKCKTELPDIEALAQKYKYRDIKFLNVSINEKHTLSNFLEDKDYQVEMLRLDKKFVLDSLNIRLFPSYFIIDPNQKVIKVSNNSKQLEKRLKEILAELK